MIRKFLLASMLLSSMVAMTQVNFRHFLTMGRIELSEDRNTEAIRNFNTAIAARPDHFEAWFFRGIAKFQLSDYNGSLSDFSETIRLHPLYARAYHYRGIVNDRLTNYYDARADFRKALEIDPYNADLYVAAGATDMHLNQFVDAIRNYDMALLIHPRLSAAWLNRGIARRLLGDTLAALSDLDKAVLHDHFDSEAWIRRGLLRSETGDYQGALTDLSEAIRLDNQNPAAFFQRAHIHLQNGDTLAALRDFEEVNVRDTRNALTYYNRALIHSLRHELPEARVLYKEVISINPNNIYSHFNLGVINFQLKNYRESDNNFSDAISLFPGFVGALVNRSLVRKELNDRAGAEADYEQAMLIIKKVDQSGDEPEQLFNRYADSTYFDRIMDLEADFISGNIAANRPQFRNIEIKPFPSFVIAFVTADKTTAGTLSQTYTDSELSQLNRQLPAGLRLSYINQSKIVTSNENNEILLPQLPEKMPYNEAQLLSGIAEQNRNNLTRSIEHYRNVPINDPLSSFARFNEAIALLDKELSRMLEEQYVRSVTISQDNSSTDRFKPKPDEKPQLSGARELLQGLKRSEPGNAFVRFNLGNILLQQSDYHPAIDAYSEAIAADPALAEAWYNRALILLYLNENRLACDDLSKAGEKGITEAYAVIRKYCSKP